VPLEAIPAITSSGVHRLNALASIARATRDSMSLGTFAGLARSLLSDVPAETVNSLILNKHQLDLLGNAAVNTTDTAKAANAIAEAWSAGLAIQNTTGGEGEATTVNPGTVTKDPTVLEAVPQKNATKEAVPTTTLQSLAALFRSSLSTEFASADVPTTPTPSVEITTSAVSVAPLVSGAYFAMDNEVIANLVANILLKKERSSTTTSSTITPQSSAASTTNGNRSSTKAAKTSTSQQKPRTSQPNTGQRGTGNTVSSKSQRVTSTSTTTPPPTSPEDDYNDDEYYEGDDEQTPLTTAPVTIPVTTAASVTSRPKIERRRRTSPMPVLNNTKLKFATTPVPVKKPTKAPQTGPGKTGERQWRKVVRDDEQWSTGQVAKSSDTLDDNWPMVLPGEAGVAQAQAGYEPLVEAPKTVTQQATWQEVSVPANSEAPAVTPAVTAIATSAYRPKDVVAQGSIPVGIGAVSVKAVTKPVSIFPIPTSKC